MIKGATLLYSLEVKVVGSTLNEPNSKVKRFLAVQRQQNTKTILDNTRQYGKFTRGTKANAGLAARLGRVTSTSFVSNLVRSHADVDHD